jgi:hypothetical protein
MNTQQISKNVDNISLDETALAGQSELCKIWPTVNEGLQVLEGIIKNPIVKVSIEAIIAAGDAIIGKICK